jgi:hypothetical protein
MTKSKLILTNHEAVALISMLSQAGRCLRSDEDFRMELTGILYSAVPSPGISAEKAIRFIENIKQTVLQVFQYTIDTHSPANPHIRITIEIDPTKDFTKPTTDLSTITITE